MDMINLHVCLSDYYLSFVFLLCMSILILPSKHFGVPYEQFCYSKTLFAVCDSLITNMADCGGPALADKGVCRAAFFIETTID